jgi:hypothetical protein
MMVGASLTVKARPNLVVEEQMPDGSLVLIDSTTSIEPSWTFDAEMSFFFWTFKDGVGVSASIHRIVVRSKPQGQASYNNDTCSFSGLFQ